MTSGNLHRSFAALFFFVVLSACGKDEVLAPGETKQSISVPQPPQFSLAELLALDISEVNGSLKPQQKTIGESEALYRLDDFEKMAMVGFHEASFEEFVEKPYVIPVIAWKIGSKPQLLLKVGYFDRNWLFLEGVSILAGDEVFTFRFSYDPAHSEIPSTSSWKKKLAERRIVVVEDRRFSGAVISASKIKVRFIGKARVVDFTPDAGGIATIKGSARFYDRYQEYVLTQK